MSRINSLVLMIIVLLSTVAVGCAEKSHGPSFDCDKAGTKVEKMICSDEELARLDVALSQGYRKVLKQELDDEYFRRQQKGWLKVRNRCAESSCLVKQYSQRIEELQRIAALTPSDKTQESHSFKTEAEKLKVMRDVVRWEKLTYSPSYKEEPEFCREFREDFIAGRNIQAVEPQFYSNNSEDPRFAALNNCMNHPFEDGVSMNSFYYVAMLGGPPYRYYHLDIDGNLENGKEEVLYHEWTGGEGDTGYTWFDLKECAIEGGAGVKSRHSLDTQPRNLFRLNVLATYEDIPIGIELYPSYWLPDPTKYRFRMKLINKKQNSNYCSWQPTSVK